MGDVWDRYHDDQWDEWNREREEEEARNQEDDDDD